MHIVGNASTVRRVHCSNAPQCVHMEGHTTDEVMESAPQGSSDYRFQYYEPLAAQCVALEAPAWGMGWSFWPFITIACSKPDYGRLV
jgi:hypothetical protein